jgi:hypothetical protein
VVHFRRPHRLLVALRIYPPTSRDLIQQFESRAENQDATFTNILARLGPLQQAGTRTASSPTCRRPSARTTSKLFSVHQARRTSFDPTTFILNQLQRDASGKIKLGLDLQGGTSFLVEMDTNALQATRTTATPRAGW